MWNLLSLLDIRFAYIMIHVLFPYFSSPPTFFQAPLTLLFLSNWWHLSLFSLKECLVNDVKEVFETFPVFTLCAAIVGLLNLFTALHFTIANVSACLYCLVFHWFLSGLFRENVYKGFNFTKEGTWGQFIQKQILDYISRRVHPTLNQSIFARWHWSF